MWPFGWLERARAIAESIAAQPAPAGGPFRSPVVELEPFHGPIPFLPRNRTEVYQVYGNPGVAKVDRAWERRSLVVAKNLPGRWNRRKGRLYVHRLVEPYLREALRRCDLLGVLDYIETLGCFNFRHQRHDPSLPLSYHSWAAAFDVNSKQNAAQKMARAPAPWSAQWNTIWPNGVPEQLVRAFESVGFSWGGRWPTYPDPMHFELVR